MATEDEEGPARVLYELAELKAEPCCWKCTPDWPGMMPCAACGNKRCPAASDCSLACTGSNEPGQPGSIYRKLPPG